MKQVLFISGTRPEIIKLAPVYLALQAAGGVQARWIATGQHREMSLQALSVFGITPDRDLGVMRPDQSLADLTSAILMHLDRLFRQHGHDLVVVQGDTTTAFAAAASAFYHRIPVAHVEAGLRSYDLRNPYPEEANRQMISALATLHFAPTERAAANLRMSGIARDRILVTGNTVVDALAIVSGRAGNPLPDLVAEQRLVLVTSHRREAWGEDLAAICEAIVELRDRFADIAIVYPVHLNPNVQRTVFERLGGQDRVHLIKPVSYFDFLGLMRRAYLILTDSGGVQEEAPSFRVPVLVLRRLTERPEAVEAGLAKIVGMDRTTIVHEAACLLSDPGTYERMTGGRNPFGDGRASDRIARAIRRFLDNRTPLLSHAEQFAA